MPAVVFEGRLKINPADTNGGFKIIRDDLNYAADPARFQLPEFDLQFIQDGSYLIPVTQGLVYSGSTIGTTSSARGVSGKRTATMALPAHPFHFRWWNAIRTAP